MKTFKQFLSEQEDLIAENIILEELLTEGTVNDFVASAIYKVSPKAFDKLHKNKLFDDVKLEDVKSLIIKTIKGLDPKVLIPEIKKKFMSEVKTHGWKVAIGLAIYMVFDHFVLPAVALAYGGPKAAAVATAFSASPLGEIIVYPVIIKIAKMFGNKDTDKALDLIGAES